MSHIFIGDVNFYISKNNVNYFNFSIKKNGTYNSIKNKIELEETSYILSKWDTQWTDPSSI
jgi:hypothetical protein